MTNDALVLIIIAILSLSFVVTLIMVIWFFVWLARQFRGDK